MMKTMSKRVRVSRRLLKRLRFFMVARVRKERTLPTRPTPPRDEHATPEPQKPNSWARWSQSISLEKKEKE